MEYKIPNIHCLNEDQLRDIQRVMCKRIAGTGSCIDIDCDKCAICPNNDNLTEFKQFLVKNYKK